MNNKIAIGATILALAGLFVVNLEQTKPASESLPLANDTQASIAQLPVERSSVDERVNEPQQYPLSQSKMSENETEIFAADDKPLPPPPPVGIPPMAPPANGQGVVSHPNHQAPVQAPISRTSPSKE
ncbi:hypothetical protein JK628_05335 [Shewanella sp. KX20019]|uniref:hypothetical protein n=1 Tax=Shewanella sp. KX20019 TaxID=2803864 RepID=UPI00192564BD|nr:hypothetical protein [Shewanella sp. KX20019]QQX81292.1 hypothetical protein JK628_05335 [Shewanella sp. KX20019]